MRKLLRKLRGKGLYIAIGVLLLLLVVFGVFYVLSKNKWKADLAAVEGDLTVVRDNYTALSGDGGLVNAYKLAVDVPVGKEITESDLVSWSAPSTLATGLILDITSVLGQYYKVDLPAGLPLYSAMVSGEEVGANDKVQDIYTDYIPIGLKVGDVIDVDLVMPFGENYTTLWNKRVYGINNGTLKVKLDRNDTYNYQSMLSDLGLYPSAIVVAVQYASESTRTVQGVNYPMSEEVFVVAEKDPSLDRPLSTDILARRRVFESLAESVRVSDDELKSALAAGRSRVLSALSQSLNKHLEEESERRRLAIENGEVLP